MSKLVVSENSVLERLYFADLYAREDAIVHPSGHTFHWIVRQTSNNSSMKTNSSNNATSQDKVSDGPRRSDTGSNEAELNESETGTNENLKYNSRVARQSNAGRPVQIKEMDLPHSITMPETLPRKGKAPNESFAQTAAGAKPETTVVEHKVVNNAEDDVDNILPKLFAPVNTGVSVGSVSKSLSSPQSEREILQEAIRRKLLSQELLKFLREDNGTFFITGKAGSGKSTLMSEFIWLAQPSQQLQYVEYNL